MLNKLGYQAELAINGQEAVDMACDGMYDLIILDLQMPIKGGLEAAREIRKLTIEQPYMAAFTANVMKEDRTESFRAGMDDFLAKPIKLDDLSELCEKVEKRQVSESGSGSEDVMASQPDPVQMSKGHHSTGSSLLPP
jgi:two-component system sensor histidine kinase/response regulator